MVKYMKKEKYLRLVKRLSQKKPRLKNVFGCFLSGRLVWFIGEIIVHNLMESFGLSRVDSFVYLAFIFNSFTTFMTAIGIFDNWVCKCKCGLIIPTMGFTHSV